MKHSFVYKGIECIVLYVGGDFVSYVVYLPTHEKQYNTKAKCKVAINNHLKR